MVIDEEKIIEQTIIEYDQYQKLYIATYGDIVSEGKTQLEAIMTLLDLIAWEESENYEND